MQCRDPIPNTKSSFQIHIHSPSKRQMVEMRALVTKENTVGIDSPKPDYRHLTGIEDSCPILD